MKKKKPGAPSKWREGKIASTEILSEGASSLLRDPGENYLGEDQAATQRDLEPDDFDLGTNVHDDRVRGAGGQSLAELVIAKEQGWGLEEHGGGLRFDQPEPNVNDYDPEEEEEPTEERSGKSRTA